MRASDSISCTAFAGAERIAAGKLVDVARSCKKLHELDGSQSILIFDDATAELVEIDFRGSMKDVLNRLERSDPDDSQRHAMAPWSQSESRDAEKAAAPRAPGRPRLGVVGREVTLLPRHWEWLNAQPGGASVALRKLVEQARRVNKGRDRIRQSQEVAFRFMSAMAGNEPGFEEASRALFAGNRQGFEVHTSSWPVDVREHVMNLAADAFSEKGT